MKAPLGLIAGAGQFPVHVAREAKRQGRSVVAIGIRGWADPGLRNEVEAFEELPVGALGALIARLQALGAREAVMAGKVTKAVLLDPHAAFDAEARRLLSGVKEFSAGALLGAIGARLAEEGIQLLDASRFLAPSLCPAGVLTARGPSPSEEADIRVGLDVARTLAALDVGQTVVVRRRVVVAVEALEGTDAAVRRAGTLAGPGLVVVKTGAPAQDRRFDLPIIGPGTVAVFREAGVSCLALEAGTALILERESVVALADAAGLCVIGFALPAPA